MMIPKIPITKTGTKILVTKTVTKILVAKTIEIMDEHFSLPYRICSK